MLTQRGWKSNPSPRRGFTLVAASRSTTSAPVVLALHDSLQALHLFRIALDEAMSRRCDLVVLDYGINSLRQGLDDESSDIEPRERMALRALRVNPHVKVIRTEHSQASLEKAVAYCETIKPSLLIVAADHVGGSEVSGELTQRLFNGDFDVLVIAEPSEPRLGFGAPGGRVRPSPTHYG